MPLSLFSLCTLNFKLCLFHEVRAGIEPANNGFADRSLTTWVPHRNKTDSQVYKNTFI